MDLLRLLSIYDIVIIKVELHKYVEYQNFAFTKFPFYLLEG